MARIRVSKDPSGHIIVSFPYDPLLIATAKTIPSHKWHPVEKILKVFEGVEVHLDPALKAVTSVSSSGKDPSLAKSSSGFPTLEKGGKGGIFRQE